MKISQQQKKGLEVSSFHTSVPKMIKNDHDHIVQEPAKPIRNIADNTQTQKSFDSWVIVQAFIAPSLV